MSTSTPNQQSPADAPGASEWRRVVTAADCEPCNCCQELVCPLCEDHYADCSCPGPHQSDEFEYRVGPAGVLEARTLEDALAAGAGD